MDHSYPKEEKLKGQGQIRALFSSGNSLKRFPIKLVYLPMDNKKGHQIGVSVPKRNFKRAVDRNRLKRQMRESYRLNKGIIAHCAQNYAVMLIYIGKEKQNFDRILSSVKDLLSELNEKSRV